MRCKHLFHVPVVLFVVLLSACYMPLIHSYKHYLSVCAMFQNEAPYLKEWIEFHRLVGVEHFYLYNNLSTDKWHKVLKPYIKQGCVTVIDWPLKAPEGKGWDAIQPITYTDAINKFREETQWMAVIDIDEFLTPVQHDSLLPILKDFEEFGGLCVNWVMYGTSNVDKIPQDKLLIEMLVHRAPLTTEASRIIKSIFQMQHVHESHHTHYYAYKPGYFQVNPDKQRFEGAQAPYVAIDKIRLNHYWTRDKDFFINTKLERRKKSSDNAGVEEWKRWAEHFNEVKDKSMLRFVPALKKRMKEAEKAR